MYQKIAALLISVVVCVGCISCTAKKETDLPTEEIISGEDFIESSSGIGATESILIPNDSLEEIDISVVPTDDNAVPKETSVEENDTVENVGEQSKHENMTDLA